MINNNTIYLKEELKDHNKKTIAIISKFQKTNKIKNILDVGFANAVLIKYLKKKIHAECEYEGEEIDKKLYVKGRKNFNYCYNMGFDDFVKKSKKKYSVIILSGILCFFKDPYKILKESLKIVKKNGIIVMFDSFSDYADIQVVHSFKNNNKKFSCYNRTSLYKIKCLAKLKKIKKIEIQKFNYKKFLKKDNKNLFKSYTLRKGIVINHCGMVSNYHHIVLYL